MDEKEGHAHGNRKAEGGGAGKKTYDQEERAKNFAKDREGEACARANAERIGKTAGERFKCREFLPPVQKQHRGAEPNAKEQQPEIEIFRQKIQAQQGSDFFHATGAFSVRRMITCRAGQFKLVVMIEKRGNPLVAVEIGPGYSGAGGLWGNEGG